MNTKQKILTRSIFGVLCIGLAIRVGFCSSKIKNNNNERPNIIFLMDDQHRWDGLGVENEAVCTPALDELAKEGVRFTQDVCQAPM